MTTTELKTIEQTINPVVTAATALVIATGDDMVRATELLSNVNKNLDRVTAEEDKVLKPLKEAVKAEQARWKPYKTALEAARDAVRKAMSIYQTAEMKRRAEAEAKLAARVEKGTMKLETAARKSSELATPEQSVSTDVGMVKFRTVQRLQIIAINMVPREYLIPDETAIKAALKAGIKVPGAQLVDEQVPVNYR